MIITPFVNMIIQNDMFCKSSSTENEIIYKKNENEMKASVRIQNNK